MSITCSQVKAFTTEHSAGGGVRGRFLKLSHGRNRARKPVEVGSLPQDLQEFLHPTGGWPNGISEPSTVGIRLST